jgi:hypothetical protein
MLSENLYCAVFPGSPQHMEIEINGNNNIKIATSGLIVNVDFFAGSQNFSKSERTLPVCTGNILLRY